MANELIKMHTPDLGESERKSLIETLDSGLIAGNQKNTKECESIINNIIGSDATFLTSSCTHALEIAAMTLDLQEGDEVIVPSYSFVSTALAFHLHGAKLRFCDVRKSDLNIDENNIEKLINGKTKAIVVLHYGGKACNIKEILKIASRHKLKVIEDNAHGLGGKTDLQPLGSFGSLSCLSFHETKNITCGEGGAICINDADLVEKIKYMREKGTNRSSFLEGKVDKYEWIEKGSNFLPSELQAAVLKAQLKRLKEIQINRERVWKSYANVLSPICNELNILFSSQEDNLSLTHHIFYLLFTNKEHAKGLIRYLYKKNIMATSHYRPLSISPYIRKIYSDSYIDKCPISEEISDCIVRLPLSSTMSKNEVERVNSEVISYLNRNF